MVVNRANSGVSVEDMERTVGMPALALIRSGGLLFVRAANEGRTVIEMFPREKITEDFDRLADRVLGTPRGRAGRRRPASGSGRSKDRGPRLTALPATTAGGTVQPSARPIGPVRRRPSSEPGSG